MIPRRRTVVLLAGVIVPLLGILIMRAIPQTGISPRKTDTEAPSVPVPGEAPPTPPGTVRIIAHKVLSDANMVYGRWIID